MRFAAVFVFAFDTQIIGGHTGTQFHKTTTILSAVKVTPIHTIEISIVHRSNRFAVEQHTNFSHIVRFAHFVRFDKTENFVDLFGNPMSEHMALFVYHSIGVGNTLQKTISPIVITQGIVNLGFFSGASCTGSHIEHFLTTRIENLVHIATLHITEHVSIRFMTDIDTFRILNSGLRIRIHHRFTCRMRIDRCSIGNFLFDILELRFYRYRNLRNQILQGCVVSRFIRFSPSLARQIFGISLDFLYAHLRADRHRQRKQDEESAIYPPHWHCVLY